MTETDRRKHVENAIAMNRLEGIFPPNPEVEEICAAYIRGEIEAKDILNLVRGLPHEQSVP